MNNDYLKDNINTIGESEIDEILNNTLKENDNYRWQGLRIIDWALRRHNNKAKEEFKVTVIFI